MLASRWTYASRRVLCRLYSAMVLLAAVHTPFDLSSFSGREMSFSLTVVFVQHTSSGCFPSAPLSHREGLLSVTLWSLLFHRQQSILFTRAGEKARWGAEGANVPSNPEFGEVIRRGIDKGGDEIDVPFGYEFGRFKFSHASQALLVVGYVIFSQIE